MPPKAKFTRQEIIDAAVDIARRAPLEAVTAQELASVLGTSTRPVFTYFRTLEEVRAAKVVKKSTDARRGAKPLPAALSAPERHRRVPADGKPQRRYPPRHPGDLLAHRRAGRRAASASLGLCSRALHADRHGRERRTGHGGGPSARRGVPGAAHCAARAARRADRHRSGQEG